MKVISDVPGHREVEFEGNEQRIHDYAEQLLDEGWDVFIALKYACRRFGTITPSFYKWYTQ